LALTVPAEAVTQEQEIHLVIGKLEEVPARVTTGLEQVDWPTHWETVRADPFAQRVRGRVTRLS
jgi:hypothetical protein